MKTSSWDLVPSVKFFTISHLSLEIHDNCVFGCICREGLIEVKEAGNLTPMGHSHGFFLDPEGTLPGGLVSL
jgi:hypothetical protein